MKETYDVTVVGAGLSGLRMARLLAEAGLSVLLADRKTDLGKGVHTTGIFVRRTLESFRLPAGCLGPPVRRVSLYSPGGRPLHLESARDEFRMGRMDDLYAHELERARSAGAVWAPGCALEGLTFLRTDTVAEFRTADGAPRMARTRFVVGADGTFSTTARLLHLDVNRAWVLGVERVLRGADLGEPPTLHVFLDPRVAPGYIAWAAHDGGELHVGAGGRPPGFQPARALPLVLRMAAERLTHPSTRAALPEPAAGSAGEVRAGAIPVGGVLGRIASARGLLIGDAAGAPSPLTAGGLDPCLRLTSVAAQAVVEHLGSGRSDALAAYRGGAFRPRFAARLAMRRLYENISDPRLLEAACFALRLPPFRAVARHVFFGDGSFPDGAPHGTRAGALDRPYGDGAIMRP